MLYTFFSRKVNTDREVLKKKNKLLRCQSFSKSKAKWKWRRKKNRVRRKVWNGTESKSFTLKTYPTMGNFSILDWALSEPNVLPEVGLVSWKFDNFNFNWCIPVSLLLFDAKLKCRSMMNCFPYPECSKLGYQSEEIVFNDLWVFQSRKLSSC